MKIELKKLDVRFYCSEVGIEPVREWLKEFSNDDRKIIGKSIRNVQYGWPVGMPLVDSLGYGLWEIRTKLSDRRLVRLLFFIYNGFMVLVNGFIKKTRKTPKLELDLAKKRKRLCEFH